MEISSAGEDFFEELWKGPFLKPSEPVFSKESGQTIKEECTSPLWKTAGKTAFFFSSFVAAVAVIGGKKRGSFIRVSSSSLSEAPLISLESTESDLPSQESEKPKDPSYPDRLKSLTSSKENVEKRNRPLKPALSLKNLKDPPPPQDPYDSLRCNQDDQKDIGYLCHALGTMSYPQLYENKSKLDALKVRIGPVHVFKFLEEIFSKEENAKHMPVVSASSAVFGRTLNMTWRGFMGGVNEGFENALKEESLELYQEAFAKRLDISLPQLKGWIQDREWEEIALHLVEKSSLKRAKLSQG